MQRKIIECVCERENRKSERAQDRDDKTVYYIRLPTVTKL